MDRISLMEAYLIEFLRVKELSNDSIIAKTVAKDTAQFESYYPKMDFSLLTTLAEKDHNAFKRIILEGYQVKFLTINGLKKLLELKLNKVTEQDYHETEHGIFQLQVNPDELKIIQQFVSNQWQIRVDEDRVDIFVGQ